MKSTLEDIKKDKLLTEYLELISGFKIDELELDEINEFLELINE